MQLVMVSWHDCWFDFERPVEGYRSEYLVRTVGFVIRDGDGILSLAQEALPGGDGFRAITHIPLSCIDSRVALAAHVKEAA